MSKNQKIRKRIFTILKKNLNKRLAELLVYDIGTYIDSGKNNLINTLAQINSMGFKMKADIGDVWALDPVLTGNQAEIQILANGKFKLIIEELVK